MAKKLIVHTSGLVLQVVDNVEETDEGLLLTENTENESFKQSLIQSSSTHLINVVNIDRDLTEEESNKLAQSVLYWKDK